MDTGQIISSIIGGVAVLLLGGIGRMMVGIRNDFRRFMREHLWLLATTMWTRDKVMIIMKRLDLPIDNPPPNDLPKLGIKMPGKAETDAGVLKQMITWLGIDGDEAEKFFGEMMKRRGHKMVPSWVDGEGSGGGNNEPSNVFGINLGGKQEKNSGSNWQYGS